MPTRQASTLLESFRVNEVLFSKTNNYVANLSLLQVGDGDLPPFEFPALKRDAQTFGDAAAFLAQAEALTPAPSGPLQIYAIDADSAEGHSLNWLNVTEKKRNGQRRSCHEWYLCLEDTGLWLTFEHGKYGYRREPFQHWSEAVARLSELLSGDCTWHQFGDAQSQNTMLGKGQFYWREPRTRADVPVDNFVFRGDGGYELKVEGVSHRCSFSVKGPDGLNAHEWYDDYAGALLRMADVLESRFPHSELGLISNPGQYKEEEARRPQPGTPLQAVLTGHFVVKSIYMYEDVLPAPVLVYKTGEGKTATLEAGAAGWQVSTGHVRHRAAKRQLLPCSLPCALRIWADVLKGAIVPAEA